MRAAVGTEWLEPRRPLFLTSAVASASAAGLSSGASHAWRQRGLLPSCHPLKLPIDYLRLLPLRSICLCLCLPCSFLRAPLFSSLSAPPPTLSRDPTPEAPSSACRSGGDGGRGRRGPGTSRPRCGRTSSRTRTTSVSARPGPARGATCALARHTREISAGPRRHAASAAGSPTCPGDVPAMHVSSLVTRYTLEALDDRPAPLSARQLCRFDHHRRRLADPSQLQAVLCSYSDVRGDGGRSLGRPDSDGPARAPTCRCRRRRAVLLAARHVPPPPRCTVQSTPASRQSSEGVVCGADAADGTAGSGGVRPLRLRLLLPHGAAAHVAPAAQRAGDAWHRRASSRNPEKSGRRI